MSYNLHTVMPAGNRSKGYDFSTIEDAMRGFETIKVQLGRWLTDPKVSKPVPGMPDSIVLEDEEGHVLRVEDLNG